MSFDAVGDVWRLPDFDNHLRSIVSPGWARAVCLHHTAAPSLAQRPDGLSKQHIRNIRDFYQKKGWQSGPHFFIDDTEGCVMGMTPLHEKGVHASTFNSSAFGIEVLGDYDREDPLSGRGLKCWENAAAATRSLLDFLGLPATPATVLFHRDDPKTTKTCPGTKVKKDWFIDLVKAA